MKSRFDACRVRASGRILSLTLAALGLFACRDLLVQPAHEPAHLEVSLSASALARAPGGASEAFDQADRIRVIVYRPEESNPSTSARLSLGTAGLRQPLVDTVVPLTVTGSEARVQIAIPSDAVAGGAPLAVEFALLRSTEMLFFGSTTVAMRAGGTAQAVIQEIFPVVSRVALSEVTGALAARGDTLRLHATGFFATGDTVPESGLSVTFFSPDPSVTVIPAPDRRSDALVIAQRRGTARVIVEAQGPVRAVSDTAAVAVNAAPLDSVKVTVAAQHACYGTDAGATYCWGLNGSGQLGYGSGVGSSTPVLVAGAIEFASISGAGSHTCGLTYNEQIYCWGSNESGQVGNGTTTSSSTPVAVQGGLSFESVSAGNRHTCGLTPDGKAYCWGLNSNGQLGDGTTTSQNVPTPVAGGLKFTSISAALFNTCALTHDGTAYCWGQNSFGVLGDAVPLGQRAVTPVQVAGGLRFVAISAGAIHTCGLTAGGEIYCWGDNAVGQLGNGTTTRSLTPVLANGGMKFRSLSASNGNNLYTHTCAITTSGQAYCWGANSEGQLGTTATVGTCLPFGAGGASVSCSNVPVPVSGGLTFTSLGAGLNVSCGRTISDAIHCWGRGTFGQLGNGQLADSSTPVRLSAPTSPPTVASIDFTRSSATVLPGDTLFLETSIRAQNGTAIPGRASLASSDTSIARISRFGTIQGVAPGTVTLTATVEAVSATATVTVADVAPLFTQVSAAETGGHTCGVTKIGAVYCWGLGTSGQLGNGVFATSTRPVAVSAADLAFRSISAGEVHTCGVTTTSVIYCWGENGFGQLGDGSTTTSAVPVKVSHTLAFRSVSAGARYTCAVANVNQAFCWGANSEGQLGIGTTSNTSVPLQVQGIVGTSALTIDADATHTCGTLRAGTVYCWGNNQFGQLGDGTTTSSTIPVPVTGGLVFRSLGTGNVHTCGVTTAGAPVCWGNNSEGQLGDGTFIDRASPTAVAGGLTLQTIATGEDHSCGVTSTGTAHCWGDNQYGHLGDGTTADQASPIPVSGGIAFTALSGGGIHTCGTTATGATYCWGDNRVGQLGDGTTTQRSTPAPIAPPVRTP